MKKRLISPSVAIFLLIIYAQQGQSEDKVAGSELPPVSSYSYMGGKGHYSSESPHYMAGKKHYLPDSPNYMVGKEQYLPNPSETAVKESGQSPASNAGAKSGENEEFKGQENQGQVNIIITPVEPLYYYEGGIIPFAVIRPRHKRAMDHPPSVDINTSHLGNLNLNVGGHQFHHHP